MVFAFIGAVFITKKAIEQYRMRSPSVVDVSTLELNAEKAERISAVQT